MVFIEVGRITEFLTSEDAKKLAMRLLKKVAELEKPPPDPRQMKMFPE